jgi:hypothetical protein
LVVILYETDICGGRHRAHPAAMQAKNVNTMRHHVIAGAARSEL